MDLYKCMVICLYATRILIYINKLFIVYRNILKKPMNNREINHDMGIAAMPRVQTIRASNYE